MTVCQSDSSPQSVYIGSDVELKLGDVFYVFALGELRRCVLDRILMDHRRIDPVRLASGPDVYHVGDVSLTPQVACRRFIAATRSQLQCLLDESSRLREQLALAEDALASLAPSETPTETSPCATS